MTDTNHVMARIWSESSTASRCGAHSHRRRRLTAAGFDAASAARLARDERVDVHELLVLLDRGCPPHLAVRIVAALDACVVSR